MVIKAWQFDSQCLPDKPVIQKNKKRRDQILLSTAVDRLLFDITSIIFQKFTRLTFDFDSLLNHSKKVSNKYDSCRIIDQKTYKLSIKYNQLGVLCSNYHILTVKTRKI